MIAAADYARVPKRMVPCPCCQGEDQEVAFVGDRYGFGLQTVVCSACGLIFTSPRPERGWFEEFYRRHYRRFYEDVDRPDAEYLARDWISGRHRRNLDWIAPRLRDQGRLLDIGCAEGTFLSQFQGRFTRWQAEGIEPSLSFSDFARVHYGLSVKTCDLDELDFWPAESCDLVTAGHVLEHVLEPDRLFQAARRLLKPGGLLVIDVPDAEGQSPGLGNLHIAHVTHFSRHTLANFFVKNGLAIVDSRAGIEAPQWTLQVLGRKNPIVPSGWKPARANGRRIAKAFALYCRGGGGFMARARQRLARLSHLGRAWRPSLGRSTS